MGGILLGIGVLAASDNASPKGKVAAAAPGAEQPSDSENALKAKEAEIRVAEEELNALQAKLNVDYVVLRTRRENLGTNQAALAAFNQDAATYTCGEERPVAESGTAGATPSGRDATD
jgi:hypothetical protein